MQCAENRRIQDKGSDGMNEGKGKQGLESFCELKVTPKACKFSDWNLLRFYNQSAITWLLRIMGFAKIG